MKLNSSDSPINYSPEAVQPQMASVWWILFISFIFLVLAHLVVKEFFPNPAIWVIGSMSIFAIGVVWLLIKKDYFAFLLVLFVCVHFSFADAQGGLWSYVALSIFLAVALLRNRISIEFSSVSISATFFLLIFLMHQVFGLLLNQYSLISNIQAIIVTFSQVIIFYYCASQSMSEANIKRLLSVWFAVICWVSLMAFNQKYHWVITSSPLLPQRYRSLYDGYISGFDTIPAGSFQNSELFGEYFCFVFVIALIIAMHSTEFSRLRIKSVFPVITILLSLSLLVASASRSAVLLAIASAICLFITISVLVPSFRSLVKVSVLLMILSFSGLLLWRYGDVVGMDEMLKDFKELNPAKITTESIASGKGINRSFTGAYHLLSKKSWLLGHGYNLPENNTQSLGLRKGASDYHSLYICMPFFYGWGGSIAFVLFIIATGVRIFRSYFKSKGRSSALVPLSLGFSVIWCVFLLDQYKISVTRNPSYFLLIWILLGLTHALANTMQKDNHKLKGLN